MNELNSRALISFIVLLVMSGSAIAFSEVRLQHLSRSGQTALFNIGVHDGVKEGEYAVVVKEINDLEKRTLRLVPVARARNIKLNADGSIWILYRRYDSGLLVKGDKFILLTESALLEGRRDIRTGRQEVVAPKGGATKATLQSLKEDKDRLAKLKDEYGTDEEYHDKEYRSNDDATLLDVSEWRDGGKSRYKTAIYKSPHGKDFGRQHRLATFEKMVVAYLRKVNDPDFSYDDFYDRQMKESLSNYYKNHSSLDTEYENFLYEESKRKTAEARVYRAILEKGQTWSQDFTDDELRGVLREISVLQEKDRRNFVIGDPRRFSMYFSYDSVITDRQTTKDQAYRRSGLYGVEGEFEAIPFVKKSDLERFTLSGMVRTTKTAFAANDYNVALDDLSIGLGLNWYPMHAPYVIQSPMIFIGTFVRTGFADARAPSGNEKGTYTSLVAPGFRAGLRYNFRNGVGLRFAGTYETIQIERYGQTRQDPQLPDHFTVNEGKVSFSVAYSF